MAEYISGVNIFMGDFLSVATSFQRRLVFMGEYFSGVNISQGEFFSGVNIFQGWISFRGEYFSGRNIFVVIFGPFWAILGHF